MKPQINTAASSRSADLIRWFGSGAVAVLSAVVSLPPPVLAHSLNQELSVTAPGPEEIAAANTETFLNDIEVRFTRAMEDRMIGRNFVLAIFLSDYSSGSLLYEEDPWLAEEVEDQARRVTRQAMVQAFAETVNNVQFLYRMKEYGRNLTSAELAVTDGEMNFDGPSLERSKDIPRSEEGSGAGSSFSSRVRLDAGFDLGLTWRTVFGPFESRLTYFLVSEDVLGMSLETRLTERSSLGLTYRVSPDESRAIGTVSFSLP